MNAFEAFVKSMEATSPPAGISPLLKALWQDGKGDWDGAHVIAQDINGMEGSWVHAYLHRKEGDLWNAGYWYREAHREMPELTLEEEWEMLVKHFLEK